MTPLSDEYDDDITDILLGSSSSRAQADRIVRKRSSKGASEGHLSPRPFTKSSLQSGLTFYRIILFNFQPAMVAERPNASASEQVSRENHAVIVFCSVQVCRGALALGVSKPHSTYLTSFFRMYISWTKSQAVSL